MLNKYMRVTLDWLSCLFVRLFSCTLKVFTYIRKYNNLQISSLTFPEGNSRVKFYLFIKPEACLVERNNDTGMQGFKKDVHEDLQLL